MLLELLGEKTEEMEDLQADLIEVKKVYKVQLEQLLGKSGISETGSGGAVASDLGSMENNK